MLEARSLTKYYGHRAAVRAVSFTVEPGEILGYLGSNGAGKSTTAFQRRLGYVPEEAHLYPHLSGREYLQLVGRLRGLPRRVLEPKMDELLRLVGLWEDRHAPLASY